MRTLKHHICIGLATTLCLAAVAASAQQKPAEDARTRRALARTAARRNALLETDPRLNVRVSLKREATTQDEAVSALGRMTKIRMRVEKDNEGPAGMSFRFQNVPLKHVLDGIAAVYGWVWVRKEGVWILQPNHALDHDSLRPHTRAQAEIFRGGRELLKELDKQPAQFLARLFSRDIPLQPEGLAFGELPAGVQRPVSAMLAANRRDRASQGDNYTPPLDDNCRVSLEKSVDQDFTHYTVNVSNNEAGASFSFCIFNDPAENTDQVVHYQDMPTSADFEFDKDDAASRLAALDADPRLKQRFSLRMRYATLSDALHALAPRAGFDFAAFYQDSGANVPERKSFTFVNLPLAAILDRLAALYGRTSAFHGRQAHTWGERTSGVIIFHLGPEDPNFKPPASPSYHAPGFFEINRPWPSDPPDTP